MAAMLKPGLGGALSAYGAELKTITPTPGGREILKSLKAFRHHDEWYSLNNLKLGTVKKHLFIREWMGYPIDEKTKLSPEHVEAYIHPYFRHWYRALVHAGTLALTRMPRRPLQFRFVITIPMRHKDGHELLVKMMGMPLDYDERKKAGAFLHSYTVVGSYRGAEPIRLDLYEVEKPLGKDEYALVQEDLLSWMIEDIPPIRFPTPMEWRCIRLIKTLREEGAAVKLTAIAARLRGENGQKETADNVKHYLRHCKRRLLSLADHNIVPPLGPPDFLKKATSLAVIEYFDQCRLLPLIEAYVLKYYPERAGLDRK